MDARALGYVLGLRKAATGLLKTEQPEDKPRTVLPALGGSLGLGGLHLSWPALTARARRYHGTGGEAFERILRKGLLPVKLGLGTARSGLPSAALYTTGHRPTAYTHGPKVVKMLMNYAKYLRQAADPEYFEIGPGNPGWLSRKLLSRHISTVGTEPVLPVEIIQASTRRERLKHVLGMLPGYVRKHPIRFGAGVAGTALSSYLIYAAIASLLRRFRPKKQRREAQL